MTKPMISQPRALVLIEDLITEGLCDSGEAAPLQDVAAQFQVRISPEMREAMATAEDGVGRQFVPRTEELVLRPEELLDPIGDEVHSPVPGLTHRYPDRVILAATKTCEVYCRFCFRRETVGESGALSEEDLEAAMGYIAARPEIWEVILTGGDPLVLSARRLRAIMERLSAIPHVGIVRLHTRVPVVAPERVTEAVVEALRARPTVYVVVHTNHVQELTDGAKAALARLAAAGIPLLSQTVLLKGVNAEAATLEALFRELLRNRVTPYYLHHCDLARGTSHFRTTIAEGQAIMAALRGRMSGIGIPTYVIDIPGGFGKVPIGPGYVEAVDGAWQITDWQGNRHIYRDPA